MVVSPPDAGRKFSLDEKFMDAVSQLEPLSTLATPPLRLLILERSHQDSRKILQELEVGGITAEVTVVSARQEFLQAVAVQDFSAVVSAYEIPHWSGLQALRELREAGKDIPFILLSEDLKEEAAAECLKYGVSDIVSESRLARLPVALSRVLEDKQLRDANAEVRQALQLSEKRNHELMENSMYAVFRVGMDGSFVSANPAMVRMLACPSLEALQSLNLFENVFRYPEQCNRLFASCRQKGMVPSAEAEWRRQDGGLAAVKLHLRYLSVPGAADQVEGIAEDVTELRALEHQLRQAQKFEAIGELAGGIAHNFNNVVGAIVGWAELGYEESQSLPRLAERFAKIREQADRAAALTRELLAFARRQDLQPRAVDLNSLVRNVAVFLEKIIAQDIELRVILRNIAPVQADFSLLEQVLMNLCLNARDAMPEGGRLLIETEQMNLDESYLHLHPRARLGSYDVLSVSDTGMGMSAEIRERIFEPFFTTKEKGKGSGMGLATAYGIVNQHGGFIRVYSEPGQGSLFRVYLPAMQGTPGEPAAEKPHPCEKVHLEGSETILFAEDRHAIRCAVRQALLSLGYRVLSAADGEEALQLCEQETPALAILDVVMPQLGGLEAAALLRERFPNLPILFTSGYSEAMRVDASQFPSSSYLQKPYSPTTLARTIRKILNPALVRES